MQLLLTLFLCAVFALCLILELHWAIRAVGYPLLALLTYLSISIARAQRQLRIAPPQSWVAIPILAGLLIFRISKLPQSHNLEVALCVIWLNLVFLSALLIVWWPYQTRSQHKGPQASKKMRNKMRKQQSRNGQ